MAININKTLMLLGSGELGKEFTISAQRLGLRVIAVDRYKNAPAMQVADAFEVIDMLNGAISKVKIDYLDKGNDHGNK